jgi:hypothetical protein
MENWGEAAAVSMTWIKDHCRADRTDAAEPIVDPDQSGCGQGG